jgi:hypothetical protein
VIDQQGKHAMNHDQTELTVNVHEAHGRVYARSEDLPGLILSDDNRQALLSIIPAAIEALYREKGYADIKITAGSSSTNIATGPGAGFQRYAVELLK